MKKVISYILVLAMLVTILPVMSTSVWAGGGEVTLLVDSATADDTASRSNNATYKTIAGAFEKAEDGDTIKLDSDVTDVAVNFNRSKKVTLDLSGHAITVSAGGFNVVNGELTLKGNGSITNNIEEEYCIYCKSTVILEDGVSIISSGYCPFYVDDDGHLIVSGGSIISTFDGDIMDKGALINILDEGHVTFNTIPVFQNVTGPTIYIDNFQGAREDITQCYVKFNCDIDEQISMHYLFPVCEDKIVVSAAAIEYTTSTFNKENVTLMQYEDDNSNYYFLEWDDETSSAAFYRTVYTQQPEDAGISVTFNYAGDKTISFQWHKRVNGDIVLATPDIIEQFAYGNNGATYAGIEGIWEIENKVQFVPKQDTANLFVVITSGTMMRVNRDNPIQTDVEFCVKVYSGGSILISGGAYNWMHGEYIDDEVVKCLFDTDSGIYYFGCDENYEGSVDVELQNDIRFPSSYNPYTGNFTVNNKNGTYLFKVLKYEYIPLEGKTSASLGAVEYGGDYICFATIDGKVLKSDVLAISGTPEAVKLATSVAVYTYDGNEHTGKVLTTPSSATVTYQTKAAVGGTYGEASTSVPSLKNVGKVYVSAGAVHSAYNSSSIEYSFEVTKKALTILGTTVADKTADGTTNATVTAGSLIGVVLGETVTVEAIASFDNATAGTNKTVTVKYTIGGKDAANYLVPDDESKTASINGSGNNNPPASGPINSVPTYGINVVDAAGGKIRVSNSSAVDGTTVIITVTEDSGYDLETITVKSASGKELSLCTIEEGKKFSFVMPKEAVSITATYMEDNEMLNYFFDVAPSDYYYDAVLWAAQKGITSGVDETHFAPGAITTRAQMVTFLWRAAGCPQPSKASVFTDLEAGSYYEKAVAWAVEKGITKGTSDTEFSPEEKVNRAQTVTFLARLNGILDDATGYTHAFKDVLATEYYNNAVAWASTEGITSGVEENIFAPLDDCLRGQIVTFIYRNYTK